MSMLSHITTSKDLYVLTFSMKHRWHVGLETSLSLVPCAISGAKRETFSGQRSRSDRGADASFLYAGARGSITTTKLQSLPDDRPVDRRTRTVSGRNLFFFVFPGLSELYPQPRLYGAMIDENLPSMCSWGKPE